MAEKMKEVLLVIFCERKGSFLMKGFAKFSQLSHLT